ncbi:cold shock domain-containing protein [Acinetobacter populi]|uniref:CSD domain-containing protein n=1 Tax=Acinetobacter populi TaxID=1582270 RepID=A0A1Z9YV63_9GAMM|nr:cold shock domain-containing protein [Acinetobacter populi]OUY06091.1 hypothetical protein CAP51_15455 [Acinetobacter populi]
MIKTGKIKKYNQDRGFGFIESDTDGKAIFFHIKDFPKGSLPQIGEELTFSVGKDGEKIKAVNIVRLDFPLERNLNHSAKSHKNNLKPIYKKKSESMSVFSFMSRIILIGGAAFFIYIQIQNYVQRSNLAHQPISNETLRIANQQVDSSSNSFTCDGRIHCSQMNSKAEANWFVRNCPGTKMDGDGDGDACENDSRW